MKNQSCILAAIGGSILIATLNVFFGLLLHTQPNGFNDEEELLSHLYLPVGVNLQQPPKRMLHSSNNQIIKKHKNVSHNIFSIVNNTLKKNELHLRDDTKVINIGIEYAALWGAGPCEVIKNSTTAVATNDSPVLLNFTIDCLDLFENNGDFGTGNWVTTLYAMRLSAAVGGVDFLFQCNSGLQHKDKLVLAWLQGFYPAPSSEWPFAASPKPSMEDACADYNHVPINAISIAIQQDLQNMALAVLNEAQSSDTVTTTPSPSSGGIDIDDVVIHFRCGDIMGIKRRPEFGAIKFDEYKTRISQSTRSIGIVTQSFDPTLIENARKADRKATKNCRRVAANLVDYLTTAFPHATKISIYNDKHETLPLAYARLVLAKQSFCGASSFCVFPVMSTFGVGYIQEGERGINPWVTKVGEQHDNIVVMTGPKLNSIEINDRGIAYAIEWMCNVELGTTTDI